MITPKEVLKNFYGYDSFRGQQEAIIQSILKQQDTIVLMPTGGGKSVCYQIPAMVNDGLTLVISPLIALMKDQVDALNGMGIPAAYLNSSQSASEQRFVSEEIRSGKLKLLYVAPERLFGGAFPLTETLKTSRLSLVAIDEAHCVSQWGHDFRPDYLMIGRLRQELPDVPFVALTATADKQTRADIADKLGLRKPKWFISSFDRPNITYRIVPKRNSFEKLLDFLEYHQKNSGIIYCLSRKNVEDMAGRLQAAGLSALPYHAGLDRQTRASHQEKFIKDKVKIMVATIAFGMGIDKSNVRFVVHMNMPQNIEGYYQETGRAGRDGLPSDALLFYSYADVMTLQRMIDTPDNPDYSEVMLAKLEKMKQFCQSNTCRRRYLLGYFDEEEQKDCGNCDRCLSKDNKQDMTVPAQMLLSTIVRLKENYGLGYCVLVLRGSKSAKVQEEHKALTVYGIGKEKSEDFWKKLGQHLQQEGYLAEAGTQFPTLKLTTIAWEKLKGKKKFLLQMGEGGFDHQPTTVAYEEGLFEELKRIRFGLAQKENVPPYVIFSDNTLVEMAQYLPHDHDSFLQISGVGQRKAENYEDHFLPVIKSYAAEHLLKPKKKLSARKPSKSASTGLSKTELVTLQYQRDGLNVFEIAKAREMSLTTIEGHIAKLVKLKKLEAETFLSKDDLLNIRLFYRRQEGSFLKPIKEHFGERYSYFQIKVAIAEEQ
ncbi:DNA helicase RecQ [Echinicola vietnamensis]|uniref:DNA helicase RecQ n=1 Tax=Echinicola vietnamensis (strain DSM 17526 / LMG 23754 / KMM 6221) TaxID=926556 RepID=L0FT40_ECHVK|nr:DNA helicase RecQ [Echinicola vietnamensis]AGA77059.1 ATP-dependent DNA helicase RecQ [Echinicola vietnamensis DSM 17526]